MTKHEKSSKGVAYIQQKYGVEPLDLSNQDDFPQDLYSIYDKVQKCFLPPFPSPTVEACKRSIVDVVSGQPNSLMSKYPGDYDLYRLAGWNDKTGLISYDVPTRLCSVYDLLSIRKENNEQNTVQN